MDGYGEGVRTLARDFKIDGREGKGYVVRNAEIYVEPRKPENIWFQPWHPTSGKSHRFLHAIMRKYILD
jgi:hypothetical protein